MGKIWNDVRPALHLIFFVGSWILHNVSFAFCEVWSRTVFCMTYDFLCDCLFSRHFTDGRNKRLWRKIFAHGRDGKLMHMVKIPPWKVEWILIEQIFIGASCGAGTVLRTVRLHRADMQWFCCHHPIWQTRTLRQPQVPRSQSEVAELASEPCSRGFSNSDSSRLRGGHFPLLLPTWDLYPHAIYLLRGITLGESICQKVISRYNEAERKALVLVSKSGWPVRFLF